MQCRQRGGLQDRPRRHQPPDDYHPRDAGDVALLREAMQKVVLPAFVKRCGARCGDIYNEIVSPISGIRYTPQ